MSSRLFQEVRESRGLCYAIYAFHWAFHDTGLFGVHAATGEADIAELMPVLVGELERACSDITEAEVARARAQIRAGLMMALESPAARAGQIARQMLIHGRTLTLEEITARIDAVTAESVREVAMTTFVNSAPTLTGLGPVGSMLSLDQVAERLGKPVRHLASA